MLNIQDRQTSLCDGFSRRDWLRIGSIGLGGLALQHLLGARTAQASTVPVKAKSVIVLFFLGGVPQHDTWDPKPNGPDAARTEFGTIPTSVPGYHVGALMPKTAAMVDRIAVLRGMSTGDNAHSSSGYAMLTGVEHVPKNRENALPGAPNDWPSMAALTRSLRPDLHGIPSSIVLPRHIANDGEKTWPGQDAGFLGRKIDPWLLTCDPSADDFRVPDLSLPEEMSTVRFNRRRSLLDQINSQLDTIDRNANVQSYDLRTEQAVNLLTGKRARDAFDLTQETDVMRDRYGRTRFGQSLLLSRRLVEAGTSLVQVNWTRLAGKENNGTWDTHAKHHESLKGWLMPLMDQAYSALLIDLEERGLLEETLVVWAGEFGHTPKINARAGRDHWGNAFSIALSGGGVKGGVVHGETDKQAGFPLSGRVAPRDYLATVFHQLGFSSETVIKDAQGRPLPISRGNVIEEIL